MISPWDPVRVLSPDGVPLEFKNRFLRAATDERLSNETGEVTEDLVAYMRRLARGDVAAIVTGSAWVHASGRLHKRQLGAADDRLIAGLSRLAREAHACDAKILLELAHGGRMSPFAVVGGPPSAPSECPVPGGGRPARELALGELGELIAAFVEGARRARDAGFDGVMIHAAHGFLIEQFLSPDFNRRTDTYGATPVGRRRFLVDVVEGIRRRCGADFAIFVKLGADNLPKEDSTPPMAGDAVAPAAATPGTADDTSPGGLWLPPPGFRMGSLPPVDEVVSGMRPSDLPDQSDRGRRGGVSSEAEPDSAFATARAAAQAGTWAIEVTGGTYDQPGTFVREGIGTPEAEAYFSPAARRLKKAVPIALYPVGGIRSREVMDRLVAVDGFPFAAMCRPFINDPNLPRTLKKASRSGCTSTAQCLKRAPDQGLVCWTVRGGRQTPS